MVALLPPPPQGPSPRPRYVSISSRRRLVRVYRPGPWRATPTTLRNVGPIHRFDHQRTQPPAVLVNAQQQLFRDPNRSVAYAAFTLSCCLVEIFGATRIIDRADYLASVVRIRRPLRLLDLRGEGAMCAGTVAAVTKTPDRGISQQWSRYFYDHPQVYGAVDGLLSASAYNDEDVITLYERAVDALYYRPNDVLPLDDPALTPAIEEAALRNNLFIL